MNTAAPPAPRSLLLCAARGEEDKKGKCIGQGISQVVQFSEYARWSSLFYGSVVSE